MTLVFDTSVLSCFARADRLRLLDKQASHAGGFAQITDQRDILGVLGDGSEDNFKIRFCHLSLHGRWMRISL